MSDPCPDHDPSCPKCYPDRELIRKRKEVEHAFFDDAFWAGVDLETKKFERFFKEHTMKDNWKHRSKMMACGNCMWWVKKETIHTSNKPIGRCRKRAPSLDGWPAVFETDWCGDHKLDEDARRELEDQTV